MNIGKMGKKAIKALFVAIILKIGDGQARALFEKAIKETTPRVPKGLKSDRWFVKKAQKEYYDEGTLEIDHNALVSRSIEEQAKEKDPALRGAYVQAWLWIPEE